MTRAPGGWRERDGRRIIVCTIGDCTDEVATIRAWRKHVEEKHPTSAEAKSFRGAGKAASR